MKASSLSRIVAQQSAAASGKVLEGLFTVVAHVRPADKPLHPRGELFSASIERTGSAHPVGVPWIDEPGTSTGLVRMSRATGLSTSVPDIYGLALRMTPEVGLPADLLFATTGLGRASRFVLFPAQHAGQRAYSTLLPYRTSSGAVTLAAIPQGADGRAFTLAWARIGRPWQEFAHMRLHDTTEAEAPSFDPVLNELPGLAYSPGLAALREGAYRAARRSRSSTGS